MKRIAILALLLLTAASKPSFGQDSEPPYGMSHLQAYSLFYENFRTKQYDLALQFGRWMLVAKPKTIEGARQFTLDKQYERLVDIYAGLGKQATDPILRAAYFDTVQILIREVDTLFTPQEVDRFDWRIKKGMFFQQNFASIPGAIDSAYSSYQEAFDMDYRRLTQMSDGYYVRILIENYTARKQKEKALEMIALVEPIASPTLATVLDESRNKLFDTPQERIAFLAGRLEKNPGDNVLRKELADLYFENEQRAEAVKLYQELYAAEPTYENTHKLGQIASSNAEYALSNKYLLEAFEKTEDNNEKKEVSLEISVNHQSLENLEASRRFARQASRIDPSWDQPYQQIASIYAAAVSKCTEGRSIEREDKAVYWLVLDYLDKAKRVNPSQPGSFQRTYNQYLAVMPTTEEKFFSSWTTGESFTIGGSLKECYSWIGESTTIR